MESAIETEQPIVYVLHRWPTLLAAIVVITLRVMIGVAPDT